MPRRNPASKEPPENSLAIASFQMIAGGEPQRGRQFLLLRFNRGAYTATAFRAAVALSLPLASPVRPYSGACRNGKRENRSSAFPEKQGRQGLLAGKLSRIFLMKREKGMRPKLGIQHFFARKLFLS